MMNQIKMYTWLAYLGALPFMLCAVMVKLGFNNLILLGDVIYAVNSYALVIVVFMSGIHWGTYLSSNQCNSINLLLTSNTITIFSWLVFLTTPTPIVLVFYCVVFLLLLLIDMKLFSYNIISKKYFITRCVVTSIVITSLLIIVISKMA
jgi:hypothetical protein